MAKNIGTHEFRGAGRPRLYNWDEWANGDAWELEQGVDYQKPANLHSSARFQALKKGMTVRMDVLDGDERVVIQFFPKEINERRGQ